MATSLNNVPLQDCSNLYSKLKTHPSFILHTDVCPSSSKILACTLNILSPSGSAAREEMMKSRLPSSVLRRIWALSDIDQDGQLDRDEFAVAMFLIDHKLSGNDLPDKLPDRVIPPSKRGFLRPARGGYLGGNPSPSECGNNIICNN